MIRTSCWKAQLIIAAAIACTTPINHHVDAFGTFFRTTVFSHRRKNIRLVMVFEDNSRHDGDLIQNYDVLLDNNKSRVSIEIESSSEQQKMMKNESDIIRMLRENPHQCAKPIETALDVLHLMNQSSHSDDNHATLSPQDIVNNISPNIAAAALRRLVSTPFIPQTFSTTKKFSQYLYKNQWSNPKNEVDEAERQLYKQLVHRLVIKLNRVLDDLMRSSTSNNNNNNNQASPKLLPKNETWHHPPSAEEQNNTMVSLNWYALADLLSSLSVLHNIPSQSPSSRNGYLQAMVQVKEEDGNNGEIIKRLFHDTVQYLAWDNKVTSSFIRCIGSRRLIRDLLHPLVIAATHHRRVSEVARWDEIIFDDSSNEDGENFPLNGESLHHLMAIASEYLGSPSSLAKVSAVDLSIALWSLTQIYQPSNCHKVQSYRSFIKACMKRLRKRSVISPARGSEIALAIQSIGRLMGLLGREEDDDDEDDESRLQPFEDILSLPLQLPGEEEMADTYISSMQTIATDGTASPSTRKNDGVAVDDLSSEAVIMFHTLVNEIIFQPGESTQIKLRSLSLQQVADILQTALALNVSRNDLRAVIIEVLDYITTDPTVLDQTYSFRDISRILLSLQRLRVGTGMYTLDLEKSSVQRLGGRFLEIVAMHGKGHTRRKCDPKTLTTVVRSGVMMFPGSNVTKSILDAASILIRDDTIPVDVSDYNDVIFVDYDTPFLLQCNDYELSWCLWAFAVARRFNNIVFLALTDQILENISDDDSFTASSASRVMWSTSVLLSLDEAGAQHDGRHIDLFHQLSPILLSSHMSPTDLSCAMYAIAKTNYVFGKLQLFVLWAVLNSLLVSYSQYHLFYRQRCLRLSCRRTYF